MNTTIKQHPDARRRGVAMIIVMLFIAIGMVMSVSFLTAQSTASESANNVERQAKSRAIAESGMAKTIAYIRNNPDWRTRMQPGEWASAQQSDGGTFSVVGEDGAIDVASSKAANLLRALVAGDGDFKDDDSDPVTITVTSDYQGVKHVVQATLQPDVDDVAFFVKNGKVIVQEPVEPEFVALGASISYGGQYDLPVTVKVKMDRKKEEPWGDFNDPINGNVNSDQLGTADETVSFGNQIEFKESQRFVA